MGSLNPFARDYCGFSAFEEAKESEIRAKVWKLTRFPGIPVALFFDTIGIIGITWEAPPLTEGTLDDGDTIRSFPRMDIVLAWITVVCTMVTTALSVYSTNFAPLSSWRSWYHLGVLSFKMVYFCFSLFWLQADEAARSPSSHMSSCGDCRRTTPTMNCHNDAD